MVQSWALGTVTASSAAMRRSSRKSGASAAWKRMRLARILFFMLAIAILFGGLTWMRTSASEEHVQPATPAERVISVDSGDTLWSLAAALKKDSIATREAVHALMERNHLTSTGLEAGQLLIVPREILPS